VAHVHTHAAPAPARSAQCRCACSRVACLHARGCAGSLQSRGCACAPAGASAERHLDMDSHSVAPAAHAQNHRNHLSSAAGRYRAPTARASGVLAESAVSTVLSSPIDDPPVAPHRGLRGHRVTWGRQRVALERGEKAGLEAAPRMGRAKRAPHDALQRPPPTCAALGTVAGARHCPPCARGTG
jgi:hypothetical protein